jgi:DNA-binding IclR family transcriptional regulator
MGHVESPTVIQISEETGYPYSTARRALEDLAAHGVLVRHMHGNTHNAHRWALSDWCKYYATMLLGE